MKIEKWIEMKAKARTIIWEEMEEEIVCNRWWDSAGELLTEKNGKTRNYTKGKEVLICWTNAWMIIEVKWDL